MERDVGAILKKSFSGFSVIPIDIRLVRIRRESHDVFDIFAFLHRCSCCFAASLADSHPDAAACPAECGPLLKPEAIR
jgi:hypothetical protein